MNKARSNNFVVSENSSVKPAGFSQILLKNIGLCQALINDNIPLEPGTTYSFECDPGIVIDESTFIRFTGADTDKRVLVITIFYQ